MAKQSSIQLDPAAQEAIEKAEQFKDAYLKAENEKARVKRMEAEKQLNSLMPLSDDWTDAGQARAFVNTYGLKIAYNGQFGWMMYTETEHGGGVWRETPEGVVKLYLNFTAQQMNALNDTQWMITDSKKAGEYAKFIRHYRNGAAIRAVLTIAQSLVYIAPDEWDADPYLLNTQNGVVDLRAGVLKPATASKHMRHICNCDYVAENPRGAEMWRNTLDTIIIGEDGAPDVELQNYLQGIAGLCALGKSYEALYMCYSSGGSGKSTMWDTIAYVLGSYFTPVDPCLFITEEKRGDNGAARFMAAELHGCRLGLVSETQDGQKLSTKQLKQMTPHGVLRGERKHRDPYTFKPTHTLVMHTNNIPLVPASDDGTWDRVKIIPYRARIRDTAADDKQYRDKLEAGAPEAVLNWIVGGAVIACALDDNLPTPDSVKSITNSMRGECTTPDSIKAFLEIYCTIEAGLKCESRRLWNQYVSYCEIEGYEAERMKDFKRVLEAAHGVRRVNDKTGSWYLGIRLDR